MIQEITIKISIGPEGAVVSKETIAVDETKASLPPPPQESEPTTMAEMLLPPPPETFEGVTAASVFIHPPPEGIEGVTTTEEPVPTVPEV